MVDDWVDDVAIDDVADDWADDVADDWANRKLPRGPTMGCHMASRMRPKILSSEIGSAVVRNCDLPGTIRKTYHYTTRLSCDMK